MARNRKRRKGSVDYKNLNEGLDFKPIGRNTKKKKKSSSSNSNNILQAVVNQLKKDKGSGSTSATTSSKSINSEDLRFAIDFFNSSPSEDAIKTFKKKFPNIVNDKTIITEALKNIKDPEALGNAARGLDIGVEDPRVQEQFKRIVSGEDIKPTVADSTVNKGNDVYKNIYTPPDNIKTAKRPSTSSSQAFTPVGSTNASKGYTAQQRAIGNAPSTVTQQIQSTPPTASYNYQPVLAQPNQVPQPDLGLQQARLGSIPTADPYQSIVPPTPLPIADTGLPEPFQVGSNAATSIDPSQMSIEAPTTGLQYNGLGITNNTPTGIVPQLGARPAANTVTDNGFHFTRKSMFGDDKNIGWLTGGAQVASGIMDIYNGYKATKLAREQYELKKNSYKLDYQNQAKLLNRDILRQERNFAAIQNRKHTGSREQYYDTINKQADKAYQKNKLDPNAANKF